MEDGKDADEFGLDFNREVEEMGQRLAETKEKIADALITGRDHGAFVSAMVAKDYGKAAFIADATNSRFFALLVRFREDLR